MIAAGRAPRIIVIGAGMGGLAAAIDLARAGCGVTLLEAAARPGGKARHLSVDGVAVAAGPTVFTMSWVFERLFHDAGADFAAALMPRRADRLARHAWPDGSRLDLFASVTRSAEAIADFAGVEEADGFRRMMARASRIHDTLLRPFMAMERPGALALAARIGLHRPRALWGLDAHRSLMGALARDFRDRRLQQLFGRYATYTGCSPYAAPATLALIAHVESQGVWLVDGGIARIAEAMAALAVRHGATLRLGAPVAAIHREGGRAAAVTLASGEHLRGDAIVFAGDRSALAAGLLGADVMGATEAVPAARRSLSAVTWCLRAETAGLPLAHHTVVFGDDYPDEFRAIFIRGEVTQHPTVYLCAEDRDDSGTLDPRARGGERLLALINAPAHGDRMPCDADALWRRARATMAAAGLTVVARPAAMVTTTPADFAALFPGSGGALYGAAGHGAFGSFARPGAVSRLPGLYLAGGTVHPGAGVPMATLSGRLAAARVLADLAARAPRRRAISLAVP